MSAAPKERQPWPMKWIVVAIILAIVPYTYLTLHYRKPGPDFRPYEDMQKRANVARLLSAGYQRIPLAAQRPAEALRAGIKAPTEATAGGLPPELRATLAEVLPLPAEILVVAAPPVANALQAYSLQFTCILPDNKQQLAGAELYVRGGQMVITPTLERLSGGLQTRTRDSLVLLTVPAGALKPGTYRVTLAGGRASRSWSLQVK